MDLVVSRNGQGEFECAVLRRRFGGGGADSYALPGGKRRPGSDAVPRVYSENLVSQTLLQGGKPTRECRLLPLGGGGFRGP